MHPHLSEQGFANIFANILGRGLEPLADAENAGNVYGVFDLPRHLLEATCNNLRIRADFPGAYVLDAEAASEQFISPEELARRMASDSHLVIFVPDECGPLLKDTIAPDQFTRVDTFRGLEEVEHELIERINRARLLRRVQAIWQDYALFRLPIIKRIDYLVNVVSLCVDAPDMGIFFHKLDLIPDRNPEITGDFSARLAKNAWAIEALCMPGMGAAERVASLKLADAALADRLCTFLGEREWLPETLAAAVFQAESGEAPAALSFEQWRFEGEAGWI